MTASPDSLLTILGDLGRALSATSSAGALYRALYQHAQRALDVPSFLVARYDAAGDRLLCAFSVVDGEERPPTEFPPWPLGQGPVSQAIRGGQPRVVADWMANPPEARPPLVRGDPDRPARAVAYVPMLHQGRVVGVVQAQSYRPEAYSPADVLLLQTMAGWTAAALENAELLAAARQREDEISALYEVARAMTRPQPVTTLLDEFVRSVVRLTGLARGLILLLDETGETLSGRATNVSRAERDRLQVQSLSIPFRPDGLVAHAWQHRRVVAYADPAEAPAPAQPIIQALQAGSFLLAPIVGQDRPLGVLLLDDGGQRRQFTSHQLDLAEALAHQLAVALENRRLIDDLRRRFDQTQALQRALTDLARRLDRDRILQGIVERVGDILGSDRVAIYLRGADQTLSCAAARGLSDAFAARISQYWEAWARAGLAPEGLRDPIYVEDAQTDDQIGRLQAAAIEEGIHSLVWLPFVVGEQLLGGMALYHDRVRPYSAEERALAQSFAEQAALTIEHAQLYLLARQREREASLLAEAGQVFNQSLELPEVLAAITALATSALGDLSLVYLLEDGRKPLLRLAALHHADPARREELRAYLARHPRPLGTSIVGEAADRREAILIPELPSDRRQRSDIGQAIGTRSLIAVPLLTPEKTLGVFVLAVLEGDHRFDAADYRLAQALGERAATAIEKAQLYERERELQRLKDEFAATVSHELRTPLTSVIGYASLALRRAERSGAAPEVLKNLNIVLDQARRLGRLVNDVLDMSRIESGRFELSRNPVDLGKLAGAIAADLQGAGDRHRFALELPDEPVVVIGDGDRLEQVLLNVLGNATKYAPPDTTVTVTVRPMAQGGQVEVRDRGIGIPPDQLDKVFERFHRGVDNSAAKQFYGTGLGLYVCRAIVEAHGGQIWAESEGIPGEGATVRFWIPWQPTAASESEGGP